MGGGHESDQDDDEPAALTDEEKDQLIAWHQDREKELLERVGVLAERVCKLLDEVETLRAQAA